MKKILHIAPTLGGGGAEILLGHIVLAQLDNGHEVEVVIVDELHYTYDNYPFREAFDKRVKLHFIKLESHFSLVRLGIRLSNYEKFVDLANHFKPNVIHSHLYQGEIFSRYKIFKDVSYVSHLHDNMIQFDLSKSKSLKQRIMNFFEINFLKRQYLKSSTKFISISNDTTAYFSEKLPEKLIKNIIQISNATNLKMYYSNLEKLKISTNLKLVSVGNLTEKKAHEFLIDVVDQLVNKYKINVTLDILGFGPRYEEHLEVVKSRKLERNIILHGNVKNVDEFLANAHIYVHSAKYEPFGMVFLEAMASSLPIVSLDGKGNGELIIDGFNGFFIRDRNVSVFTQALLDLYSDEGLYHQCSLNSKIKSVEFDISKYVKKLDNIYSKNEK